MPSDETYRKLRVFIACPDDVSVEKNRLPNILERLKKQANESVFLELLEWRKVVPDMGRPQQIIFDQSDPKTWDIFIGILWHRFGSPSGAVSPIDNKPFESGTHEEFLTAYGLWKNLHWPRILFYHCTRSINLNLVDAEQLASVRKFFAEFRTEGAHSGIYQTYDTVEQFAELAYDHITALIKDAAKDAAKVSTLKSDIEKKIGPIDGQKVQTDTTATKDLLLGVLGEIETFYEGSTPSLPTGFVQFDQITSGLHGSEMVVIAGPPGIGKTALAMNIAEHVAIHVGKGVAFFTLEMSSSQLVQRLLCSIAKVDLQRVRHGFLSERDFPLLTAAASKLATAKLFIDDSPGLTIADLRSKALKIRVEHDIRLIVIDYLQLLDSTLQRDRRRTDNSELSSGIKNLAKELKLPIVLTVSTNRQAKTKVMRPRLEDFDELNAVERDADVVALLFRADYYETDDEAMQEEAGKAELIIAKQRNGPTGTVLLTFLKQYTRFENRAFSQ